MGGFVDGGYAAAFRLPLPIDTVRARLQEADADGPRWAAAWPSVPGSGPVGTLEESSADLVLLRKTSEPCAGSLVRVALTAVDGGTDVSVTQTEVPAWAAAAPGLFVMGGDLISADLALFLQTGVVCRRHMLPWGSPGFLTTDDPAGQRVASVFPDGLGADLGLQPGDLLIGADGQPVVTQWCLQVLARGWQAGHRVQVDVVRDGELLALAAAVTR